MTKQNTRRGNAQLVIKNNPVNIPELVSGASTQPVMQPKPQQQALKMPKQVRQYPYLTRGHGFTLIELLIVVLIIGILAAVALPQYQKAVAKARAMESLTLLRSVVPAVREYILANNAFPTSFDELSVVPSGELGKWEVEHDMVTSANSSVVIAEGRLDAGLIDTLVPGFIYPTEFSTFFTYLEPNHIYCYHMDGEEQKKQICASLGTMVKNNGKDTRFFRID